MIYLDSSAVAKLALDEAESEALLKWLTEAEEALVSSALIRTEAVRAVARTNPDSLPEIEFALLLMEQISVSEDILDHAAEMPPMSLRSLDAVHLASAEVLGADLTWFVSYDKRLCDAAEARGLPVIAPA